MKRYVKFYFLTIAIITMVGFFIGHFRQISVANKYPESRKYLYFYYNNQKKTCFNKGLFINDISDINEYSAYLDCKEKNDTCLTPKSSEICRNINIKCYIIDTIRDEFILVDCFYKNQSGRQNLRKEIIVYSKYLHEKPIDIDSICGFRNTVRAGSSNL